MRILVTNDDGVDAPGLWALAEALSTVGEVTICAPDREQSGVGASLTLHHPLRLVTCSSRIPDVQAYSVDGTPGDSVIMGLNVAMHEPPDLVVAGINEGSNLGNDALLSGTLGAALQSYFLGISSVAISVAALRDVRFDVASSLARGLAELFQEEHFPKDLLLSVNVPNLPWEELEDVCITRLAKRRYADRVHQGHDGRRVYHWIQRQTPDWVVDEGTDIWAIRNKRISMTPLGIDLTRYDQVDGFQGFAGDLGRRMGFSKQ